MAHTKVKPVVAELISQRNLARRSRDMKEDEIVFLREELARAKLDAEIYERMYDVKRADCDKLLVKLGQAAMQVLGDDLHEERHVYVTKLETQLANTREAVEWLWGFWDGNTLIARPGYEDDIREAWGRLLVAVEGAE